MSEPTVTAGSVLRAEATQRTYRISKVEDGKVHVPGMFPIPLSKIKCDIEEGRLTVVKGGDIDEADRDEVDSHL